MGQNPLLGEPNWQRISATLLQKMPRGIGLIRSSIIRACRLSPVSFVEHQFSIPPIAMERRRFAYDGWGNVQSLGGSARSFQRALQSGKDTLAETQIKLGHRL